MNDPFGRSDRTIILPDPGGRRRAVEPPPAPAEANPFQPTPIRIRHRPRHRISRHTSKRRVPRPRRTGRTTGPCPLLPWCGRRRRRAGELW